MRGGLMVLASAVLLGGCGYFNSLYNANRSFAAAERASRTGDRTTAEREYLDAIDRAAVSYRKYPDGRWADDALLLLGRARFALHEYDAAAGAMRSLLQQSSDPDKRALAHAYLGASLFVLEEHAGAEVHLDSAAAALDEGTEDGAFVRLWLARTAFETGRTDAGWTSLAGAASHPRSARPAAIEGVRRGLQLRDSARVFEHMHNLAGTAHDGSVLEVDSILLAVGREWSPAIAFNSSAPLAGSAWPPEVRDAIALTRARLAVDAGDPAAALELTMNVAEAVNRGIGSQARRMAAEIRLRHAVTIDELDDVRALLLPAYDDRGALELLRRVRGVQVLVEAGRDPASSLSLFAAAEMLRDEVGAPLLAQRTFLDYAEAQSQSVWAGKAALAAHEIAQTAETEALLERLAQNPYVRVARGGAYSADDIDRAEERLAYGIAGLRTDALAEALRRDVVVGRAVTVLDSTLAAIRTDSIRIACGMLIDSLSIRGIRADSTRSACLRGDSTRVRFVITADTVLLRDTTGRADLPIPSRGALPDTTVGPDTTAVPDMLTLSGIVPL